MIDKTISHYKILEKLGGGGMGVVYKAGDLKLDRIVALKFLPPELTRDEEAKNRFIHEAKAASSLDHNNICAVHEIDETDDGQIFICMNYYEGETLKKKIAKGPLRLDEAINNTIQIAAGLQKAHEKGIIHRDIKPANIFKTNDGTIKILDFGLAKLSGYSVLTKVGETLGTTAYMSPEQARGENLDNRTDIWSLGVVLYEMITGKLPFKGEFEQSVIYSILNEEPEPVTGLRSNIPMELEKIIFKSLRKNQADRYQHVEEMIVDLNSVKQESQHLTVPHPMPKQTLKFNKRALIAAGALILIVTAAVVWYLSTDKDGADYDRSKSIGVLPFVPLNKTSDDSVFADGIHDDILTQLSKITDLRVIARSSMILYRDTKKRLNEIGDELDARYLLEGSVRRVGNKIRITAQLIDSETEGHVWADVFDRNEADVFAIQSEIANRIAEELNLRILPSEKRSIEKPMTSNLLAYDYYLKGMYYWRNYLDFAGNSRSAEMFDSAAYYDPDFYQAFAWASIVHGALYSERDWDPSPERLQKSKTQLEKAAALAPNAPEVIFAKGHFYFRVERKKYYALKEYEKIITLWPTEDLFTELVALYKVLGEFEKAGEMCRKRESIDPMTKSSGWESFLILGRLRKWDAAKREAEEYLALHPDNPESYQWLINIYIRGFGDLKGARKMYEEGDKLPPYIFVDKQKIDPWYLWQIEYYERKYDSAIAVASKLGLESSLYSALVFFATGDLNKSKQFFNEALNAHAKLNRYNYHYALCLAGTGRSDEAIKLMHKIIDDYSKEPAIDIYYKQIIEEEFVRIYMICKKYKEAIDLMEDILKRSGTLTRWQLRLDPLYDPLRKDERFKKLIAIDN